MEWGQERDIKKTKKEKGAQPSKQSWNIKLNPTTELTRREGKSAVGYDEETPYTSRQEWSERSDSA